MSSRTMLSPTLNSQEIKPLQIGRLAEAVGDGIEQCHVEEVVGRPTDLDDPNMFLQAHGDIVTREGPRGLTHHALAIGLMMAQ